MKKAVLILLTLALAATVLVACGSKADIKIVSREDGSGTRGAFIELFGIEEKQQDGGRKDLTTKEAVIAKATDAMLTTVSCDERAIGYISIGSMNDTVKALRIEGVDATAANVKNGTYPISRPFMIATKGTTNEVTQDFIGFILSAEGQAVVGKSCTTIIDNAPAYSGAMTGGKIVVVGSSSVNPVMEKLKEAYISINPGVNIEIQSIDSTAGMTAAMDGTCDIGMASRELKESELAVLTPTQIAIDGIAVIVNKNNAVTNLTKDQVKDIFTGKTTTWSDVKK